MSTERSGPSSVLTEARAAEFPDGRASLDPRDHERLFGGPLSDDDRAAFERRAEREPEIARALILLAPLDRTFHRTVLQAVRKTRRHRHRIGRVGVAVAVAASVSPFLLPRSAEPPHPTFAVKMDAGWRRHRGGGDDAVRVLEAGAPVVVLARPDQPAAHPFDMAAFVYTDTEGWLAIDGTVERSPSGGLRLKARWPTDKTARKLTILVGEEVERRPPKWLIEERPPPPEVQVEVLDPRSMSSSAGSLD